MAQVQFTYLPKVGESNETPTPCYCTPSFLGGDTHPETVSYCVCMLALQNVAWPENPYSHKQLFLPITLRKKSFELLNSELKLVLLLVKVADISVESRFWKQTHGTKCKFLLCYVQNIIKNCFISS